MLSITAEPEQLTSISYTGSIVSKNKHRRPISQSDDV